MFFIPVAGSMSLEWGKWDSLMSNFLYLSDSIFSEIVWIDKLHYFDDGVCFLNSYCYRNRKNATCRLQSNGCHEGKKASSKTWIS